MKDIRVVFFPNMDLFNNDDALYHKDAGGMPNYEKIRDEFFSNFEEYKHYLTARQAQVLELFLEHGSLSQVAGLLGVSRQAVCRHYWKAVLRLREALKVTV